MKCKKCNNYFPTKKIIDGKNRNLCNRSFCLECSPFNCHNTKPELVLCEKTEKNCSRCNCIKPLSDFYFREKGKRTSWCKRCLDKNSVIVQRRRKEEIVAFKGGKCERCGYDKCIDALEFHHRNPAEKDSSIRLSKRVKLETILKEIDKCDLLCANCHREIHHELNLSTEAKHEKTSLSFELS